MLEKSTLRLGKRRRRDWNHIFSSRTKVPTIEFDRGSNAHCGAKNSSGAVVAAHLFTARTL